MLKEFQEDRVTTYYSGRDFDQIKSSLDRMITDRNKLKSTLVAKLSEALRGQDEKTIQNIFSAVDQVLAN